jgi:ubiquinone/menaquinone biosynthesis C-methylase UbiE
LSFAAAAYDRALLFFLLHEQPEAARRRTLAEAIRVVRPGGEIVILDYHRPYSWHPLYWPMQLILRTLEPFALDLWRRDIQEWLPPGVHCASIEKRTLFGGLYQLIKLTV